MSNSVKLIAVNDPNRKAGDVYEASKQVADLFVENGIAKLSGEEYCLEKANEEVLETVAKPAKKLK